MSHDETSTSFLFSINQKVLRIGSGNIPGGIMKRLSVIGSIVLAGIVLISFQNCSQSEYASDLSSEVSRATASTTEELRTAVEDINSGKAGRISPVIRVCPMISCAAPPEGCRYVHDSIKETSKSACNSSCGRLVCDRQPPIDEILPIDEVGDASENNPIGIKQCQIAIRCAAPEPNCQLVNQEYDKNGCQVSCGQQVCPRLPPIEEPPISEIAPIQCPMIMCAQEEGCAYAGQPTVDKNGCAMDCGQRVCDSRISRPIGKIKACPAIAIACLDVMPGPGCHFDYSSAKDQNGCVVGCPSIVCTGNDSM